jgi:glycosyltransferase involved in cell wall biosynthesis
MNTAKSGDLNDRVLLSLIIPVFNEEDSLPNLFSRLDAIYGYLDFDFEEIFVDNASTDLSAEIIKHRIKLHRPGRLITFSRNFGPSVEASLAAGFKFCSGEAAVVLYSDLQDPPELIPSMVTRWLEGFDVVHMVQVSRQGEPLWRRAGVRIFYRLMDLISDNQLPSNSGDFRLVSRKVIDEFNLLTERSRYTRGLFGWIGFKQTSISYRREPRLAGSSKAGLFSIIRTGFTATTAFSMQPLRLLTGTGFLVAISSFFAILVSIALAFAGNSVPGLTTVVCLLLFSLGTITFSIGLVGEYIGRILMEVKKRPMYIISEITSSSSE